MDSKAVAYARHAVVWAKYGDKRRAQDYIMSFSSQLYKVSQWGARTLIDRLEEQCIRLYNGEPKKKFRILI